MREITPFPDQFDLINGVRNSMRRYKSVLMQSATGTGKTVMASYMMQQAHGKGSRCIFVVPRRELLRQTAKTLDGYRIPYGCIAAGYTDNPFARIRLATSGTLARRLDTIAPPNILFVDECHFGGGDIDRIIKWAKDGGAWVIGLSATPWKLSGKGLGDWFDDMVQGPQIRWLIDNKRLSDYRLFAPNRPDLSKIKTTAGDYNKGQLDDMMTADRVLIGNAVKHYREHAMGRLNVAFGTSVKHAEIIAQSFRDAGIPAAHVSGAMDDDEIARRVKAFARRELLVLSNCELLTFGFDLAAAANMDVTVEAMSDLRPTKSLSLQMQKWGRVLRMKDYHAMIFDHAGNSDPDLHGLPDSDRQWSLNGRESNGRKGQKTEPTRQCETCYFVHRPSPCCPNCGFVYPIKSREVEEIEGELMEVSRDQQKQAAKEMRMAQGMAKTYSELVAHFVLKGSKNPHYQAKMIMDARKRKHA